MADQSSSFQFEDVPLEEARRMGRGPRMEPMLYDTLRQKIQSLSSEAVRIHLGPEIRPERMKNYILRIARELNVFWRASEEDLHQAQEIAGRLQSARQPQPLPQARPRGRRPRGPR
jgi:hypothetical protein